MPLPPATVLVVDDDEFGREAFAWLLRDAGFVVREAGTGEEAIQLAADGRTQLVVLDVVLPDIEGYEVCRRLKSSPASGMPLVLMVSGQRRQVEDRVVGLEEGADGYLSKPVDPAELVAQVRALLRVRQAEEAAARAALLLASVRDAIIVTDLNGEVTYWNEGATRLFGWQAAEMMGRLLIDHVPEHARGRLAESLQAVAAGDDLKGEFEDYRKDGTRVWIDAHFSPISDTAGRVVGVLRVAYDITERKQAGVERESLITELREALAAVKTLRGLLPICAWCKQIRTDSGYWKKLEAYLQEHLDVSFTHGICPACIARQLAGDPADSATAAS
jgi:PAS domain S-box-containing protein